MDREKIVIQGADAAQNIMESNWLLAAALITVSSGFVLVVVWLFRIIIKRNEEKHVEHDKKFEESNKRHKEHEATIELLKDANTQMTILLTKHDVKIDHNSQKINSVL